MINVSIKADVDRVTRALSGMKGEINKAAARALNDAASKSNTVAKREVKKNVGLKRISDAAKYIRIYKANPTKLIATIGARLGKAARVSLKDLSYVRTKGSEVSWKAGGDKITTSNAFQGKGRLGGHYYKRYQPGAATWAARRKITKLTSRSAGDAIMLPSAADSITKAAGTTARERFAHHMNRTLIRLGIRK